MIVMHFIYRRAIFALTLFVLFWTLAACGDNDGVSLPDPEPSPAVAAIRIEPLAPELAVGQSARLTATPLAANGEELRNRPVVWRSENPLVAAISTEGVVTALATGNTVLVAASGAVTSRIGVTVSPGTSRDSAAFIIFDTPGVNITELSEQRVTATVRDSLSRILPGRVITWETDKPDVAIMTADGRVVGVSEGNARLTARHGALQRVLQVRVNPWLGGEVVFDVVEPSYTRPTLYRLDISSPFGSLSRILEVPGALEGSTSPDGSSIAFTCQNPGPAICVASIYGHGLRVLTEGDRFYEDQPAWSTDGQRIAFRRYPQGATPGVFNPTDIWVMDTLGGQQVNLTADSVSQHHPAWSPRMILGAYRLAFTQDSAANGYVTSRIGLMRADGTERQLLTQNAQGADEAPSWKPDGSALLFTRHAGAVTHDIFQYDLTTGVTRSLLSLPGVQEHPVYSPNGRYIGFLSSHEEGDDRSVVSQVYTMRADGTHVVRRTGTVPAKEHLTWRRVP